MSAISKGTKCVCSCDVQESGHGLRTWIQVSSGPSEQACCTRYMFTGERENLYNGHPCYHLCSDPPSFCTMISLQWLRCTGILVQNPQFRPLIHCSPCSTDLFNICSLYIQTCTISLFFLLSKECIKNGSVSEYYQNVEKGKVINLKTWKSTYTFWYNVQWLLDCNTSEVLFFHWK